MRSCKVSRKEDQIYVGEIILSNWVRWRTGGLIPWAAPSQKAKHEINGDNTTYTALMETGIVSFKHGTYL